MSLNGLDEAPVIEAYQAALAEPGGWFLLKYVTRDTIDLLRRGTGGVVEVRLAIEQYEEKSPVYGLVQYRRRKVILKYVPDGTSRLLQARLTVQFQSVLEKFNPHETVFNFAAATELTDSALSSACMLHASIGSLNSSSSSIHRHRLGEIAEDAEEASGERRKSGLRHSVLSDADSGFKEGKNNLGPQPSTNSHQTPDSHLPTSEISSTSTSQISVVPPIPTFDKSLPATPVDVSRTTIDGKIDVGEARTPTEELLPPRLEEKRSSLDSRRSSQPTRPIATEQDRNSSYTAYILHKPKVKLGPRPSAQRPRTAGARSEARPVANLPNSVRISNRPSSSTSRPPSSASHRPISQQSNRSGYSNYISRFESTPPPPLPPPSIHISALYQPPNSYLLTRPASPALSATTSVNTAIAPIGPPGITLEKQRLMRALQLRKKQQMAKAAQSKPPSPSTPAPTQETQKTPGISSVHTEIDSGRVEEDPSKHARPEPAQANDRNNETVASGQDVTDPMSATDQQRNFASQKATTAEHIEPYGIVSQGDINDVDVISSTMDSESATSDEPEADLKFATVVQSKTPLLPPIIPQNRLSIGVLSRLPEQDAERTRSTDGCRTTVTITEVEEKTNTTAQACSTVSESASSVSVAEILSSQPDSAPPESAQPAQTDATRFPREAETETAIDETTDVTDNAEDVDLSSADQHSRCSGMVGFNKGLTSPTASDTSDDESLYDELQTATVEEAKPVMVARSPINAVFNRASPDSQREHNGSISILSRRTDEGTKSTPERAQNGIARSSASAIPLWPPAAESAQSLLIKKTNVSTGISKRIKALEMFSGRADAPSNSPNPAAPPSPPLTAGLVKTRLSSHSPEEAAAHSKSMSTPPAKQLHYPSPAPTPTPMSASANNQPPWLQKNGSSVEVHPPRRKGDSISVTARIIRESALNESVQPSNPSKPNTMTLHRSPLVVEHERAERTLHGETLKGETTVASDEPEALPKETTRPERRRFSLSSSHSNSGQITQSDSFTKRLSMTIRHARTESNVLPRSTSDSSSIAEENVAKGSRKNRLMRRMSVLTKGPRRSIASALGSNTLRQDDPASLVSQPPDSIAEHSGETSPNHSSLAESHAHVVDIGDVNIQFPDTLLWKRRFMRIDDQGFLILTPPTMEANKRGISRRFHLSDIKQPCLPALEREELPWSILLDFEDGSCLQCACESRYAQGQVLRMLIDAHAAYRTLYVQS